MNVKKPRYKPQSSESQVNKGSEGLLDKKDEQEIGGFENRPEPTRYGDWDVNGRCSDF